MITSLQIRNFKSIEDSGKLELKPLTFFVGPNCAGKSNIIEPLAVLGQTNRLPYPKEHSLIGSLSDGELIKYPHPPFAYVAHKGERSRPISFEVHIGLTNKASRFVQLLENRKELSNYIPTKPISSIGYGYSYTPATEEASNSIFINEKSIIEVARIVRDSTYQTLVTHPKELEGFTAERSPDLIFDERCFDLTHPSHPFLEQRRAIRDALSAVAKEVLREVADNFSRVYLMRAQRGRVEPTVKTGGEPSWVGINGEYLLQILALCFGQGRYSPKAEKINQWAEKFGIGTVRAGWWGKDELGSDFEDPKLRATLNLAVASFGSKQVLSIITQLFWSEPGDLIMIEEPEMSLHLESQVLLQDLFAQAVADGKQIICTTHSPFSIVALSKVIKSGKLSRDNIAIYHVEKEDNGTKAKKLELDERGFVTGWIPSYLKVENELFDEWAESLERA